MTKHHYISFKIEEVPLRKNKDSIVLTRDIIIMQVTKFNVNKLEIEVVKIGQLNPR